MTTTNEALRVALECGAVKKMSVNCNYAGVSFTPSAFEAFVAALAASAQVVAVPEGFVLMPVCQYPNCGCTSRATCNLNYDAAPPAKQAALARHCPYCGYDHSAGPLCKTAAAEQQNDLSPAVCRAMGRFYTRLAENKEGAAQPQPLSDEQIHQAAKKHGFYIPKGQFTYHFTENGITLFARALLSRADSKDGARLDFMIKHEAWVAFGKDGESCRVFSRNEDGDDVPMLGWGARHWRHDPRAAIDAAMSGNAEGAAE